MDSTPNPSTDGWVNPRRPLTAVKSVTGELASGEKLPRCRQKRRAPIVSTNWDPVYWVYGGRPYTSIAPFVNPYQFDPHPRYGNLRGRHAPTAMTDGSGGVSGSSSTSSLPLATPKYEATHTDDKLILHRHPPNATQSNEVAGGDAEVEPDRQPSRHTSFCDEHRGLGNSLC